MYKNKRLSLGFIGIGLMGKPMVLRLLLAEYDVYVWNRSRPGMAEVAAAGAVPCQTAAEVVERSDVIMLSLANSEVVSNTVTNPAFMEALESKPDKIVVDHSSISPEVTRSIARRVSDTGAHWIDAPVSGGVAGAEQGSLVVMAGGEKVILDRVQPIMAAFASRVTHMGPTGTGQTAKLCNQVIVGCNISAIAEAIRLANAGGVDASRLPSALAGGFADSLPLQIFGKRMADGTETPVSIKMETMLKDLDGAIEAASGDATALTLTRCAAALMRDRCESGDAERCITSLIIPAQETRADTAGS